MRDTLIQTEAIIRKAEETVKVGIVKVEIISAHHSVIIKAAHQDKERDAREWETDLRQAEAVMGEGTNNEAVKDKALTGAERDKVLMEAAKDKVLMEDQDILTAVSRVQIKP